MLRRRASLPRVFLLVAIVAPLTAVHASGQSAPRLQRPTVALTVADLPRLVHFDDLRALRTFFERVDVSGVAEGLSRPTSSTPLTMDAVLGRMPVEWQEPFAFVQGGVAYVPYEGSVRGARGTLESGSGNSLDQALLLRSLLEARGVRARLVRGRLDWAEAARLTAGTRSPAAPRSDDPWPRWLEGAADHWWVQARREDSWIDMDPSFPDTPAGQAVGTSPVAIEGVPDELNTTVQVELLRGELPVAEVTLPAALAVGQTVGLGFTAQSGRAVALWQGSEAALATLSEALGGVARNLGWLPPRRPRPSGRWRPSDFQRIALDPEAGPWVARLEVPGRTLEVGPFERADLDSFLVRVTVRAPLVPEHVLRAPWGDDPEGRLSIVIGAGRVSDARLASEAQPLYEAVERLAVLEQQARGAMRPPLAYQEASETLAAGARAAWDTFARVGPGALGWVILQCIDRVSEASPSGRVIRQGLRMAAVRWRPADGSTGSGSMEIRVSDPVTIGLLRGSASAASLRAANGVLQSAVLSQVLNRVADRAPETAFDVTLRAIGTRRAISTFRGADELPESWPAMVRAEASVGLRSGYAVLAPESFAGDAAGWWDLGIFDGETLGWVPGTQTAMQGRVDVDAAAPRADLESLLASLPSLHRALRWLTDVGGGGASTLASVPSAACASAAVAAEAISASVPDDWPHPDVVGLCGPR